MIENEEQYKITMSNIEQFNRSIEHLKSIKDEIHPIRYDVNLKAFESQLESLNEEVKEYIIRNSDTIGKISWLDSVNMYSTIHLTTGTVDHGATLCGYNYSDAFSKGTWKPYRVPKTKGICWRCINKVLPDENLLKMACKTWKLPENDTTKWIPTRHGAKMVKDNK